MKILGVSAYYHDSAACLIDQGEIVSAAQEERFTRKKHDSSFPTNAVRHCLKSSDIKCKDIDFVVYYEKPFIKFERLLETYLAFAPRGIRSFTSAMPVWLKEKLFIQNTLMKELNDIDGTKYNKEILFTEHHEAHAASAFFCSPFQKAAFMTIDGVGEWTTTALGYGENNQLHFLKEIKFPHSLGLLYSALTYYTGFKVNSGEYKVMGLAPYGKPKYVNTIKEHLIDIKKDGSFKLNLDFFNYCAGLTMTSRKFHTLFGGPPRQPESKLTQKEMDLASSVQVVTEEIIIKMASFLYKETGIENLCLAGGVALNCVANGKLLKAGPYKKLWIQPAAGDAGGAVGAALSVWHRYLQKPRIADDQNDAMRGAYLGPNFTNQQIQNFLNKESIKFKYFENEDELINTTTDLLNNQKVIGWFQGSMEFGPRALGNRSIIGDPRNPKMQTIMNLKIKFRESFRPFAPSVLLEEVNEFFDLSRASPYMLLVAPVSKKYRHPITDSEENLWGIDKLNIIRSDIPAITHVDYSARVQTVDKKTNPRYWKLINMFREKTNVAVVINTSFNVRGEPIVCSPKDAYLCFMRTEMDYLILGNYLIDKQQMGPLKKDVDWQKEFELD